MKRSRLAVVGLYLLAASNLQAEDAFYQVPIGDLELTEGTLPQTRTEPWWRWNARLQAFHPTVVLDGEGEAYFDHDGLQWPEGPGVPYNNPVLVVRAAVGRDVTGSLSLPQPDGASMARVRFRVPASRSAGGDRAIFYRGKQRHYERLASHSIPGGAWFRRQAVEAERAGQTGGAQGAAGGLGQAGRILGPDERASDLEQTYAVFSGGRALSENLQLDRLLPPRGQGASSAERTVEVGSLPGIDIAAMDWDRLTRDLKPETDPLAASIPADQHALFFPSFQAMISLMDEADAGGTPIVEMLEPRAEDARTRDRYERQLCLAVSALSRLLGPQVIRSVAFTGSDPYLRTGTDVAVLFEARQVDVLRGYLLGQQQAAGKVSSAVKVEQFEAEGVRVHAAVAPDRTVSSYMAVLGDVVAVTNSLQQLRTLLAVRSGKTPALASLKEYIFFRGRYRRGDTEETGLLIVSDAAIRRWCGPRWRIAASRRTLAAAVLSDLQAEYLDKLVKGQVEAGPIHGVASPVDLGEVRLAPRGITSATYGTLEFLTPIAELPLEKVSELEASVYRRWRDTYQSNWRQYFDPIAVRFTVRPEKLGGDVTVMPLIAGTEYREFIRTAGKAKIASDAGDRHAGSLIHFAMALDVEAETLKQYAGIGAGMTGLKVNPLSWLGQSVALYVDADPFWDEVREARSAGDRSPVENVERFLEKNWHRLPIAARVEATDALKLTAFITGLRAFTEQSAPRMTLWEALEHNGSPYVKVAPAANAGAPEEVAKAALYYAAAPRFLLLTLNEGVLKRALERSPAQPAGGDEQGARTGGAGGSKVEEKRAPGGGEKGTTRPWLGESVCLQVDRGALDLAFLLGESDYRGVLQARAWSNLPILNEWKRRYPDLDPVKVHESWWQARLVSPGGGGYTWNAAWQTMESTAYGHPGEPKPGPVWPEVVSSIERGNFGLTFEENGLRARAELERRRK